MEQAEEWEQVKGGTEGGWGGGKEMGGRAEGITIHFQIPSLGLT